MKHFCGTQAEEPEVKLKTGIGRLCFSAQISEVWLLLVLIIMELLQITESVK